MKLSVGEGTIFSGIVGLVGSLWFLAKGEVGGAIGLFACSVILVAVGYGITRLEKPPNPPPR